MAGSRRASLAPGLIALLTLGLAGLAPLPAPATSLPSQSSPAPPAADVLPDAALRGTHGTEPLGWEITATLPAVYTTYAIRESTGAGLADRPDWHRNPDVLAKWSHQYDAVRVTVSAGLLLDRYATVAAADASSLQGRVKLALTDGRADLFVAYASYTATLDYERDFHARSDALHDAALGLTSAIGFGRGGEVVAYRDSAEPGQSSASLDVRVGRRWADPGDLGNMFLAASADLGHNLRDDLTLSLVPSLRVRWYESYHGGFRRDVRLGGLVRAAWTPRWLRRIAPRSELSLGVGYHHNASTLRPLSYTQWEIGPSFEFGHRF